MTDTFKSPHLPLLFSQAKEVIAAPFRPILKHFGLTEQQWRTLRVLHDEGVLEPWQLCEICHFHSSSMTGVLARMEDMDLIRKERMETDQRRVLIHLTGKSRALVGEIMPLIREQYRLLSSVLGEQRLAEVQAFLETLVALKDTDIPRVTPPPRKAPPRPKRSRKTAAPSLNGKQQDQ